MNEKEQKKCDKWNNKYPIGITVERTDDMGKKTITKTRSEAYVLGDTAVIFVEDVRGAYILDRIKPGGSK